MFGDMHCRNCISKAGGTLASESMETIPIRSLGTLSALGDDLQQNSNGLTDVTNSHDEHDIPPEIGNIEEKMTTPEPSPSNVFGKVMEATFRKQPYRPFNTEGMFFGDRFSLEGLDLASTVTPIEIGNSDEIYYDPDNDDPDVDLNPGGDSHLLGLKKWLPPDTHNIKIQSQDLGSQLPKKSTWGSKKSKLLYATFTVFFVGFVITVIMSAAVCFYSHFQVKQLESRVTFLEDKLNKFSDPIEGDISLKIAESEVKMEQKTEKQISVALNAIHGQECNSVAWNCAWNFVMTIPKSLFGTLFGLK